MRRLVLISLLSCGLAHAASPNRIVSLAPSITEMLYALGLGPRVVGDTTFCTYPAEARGKPKVGTFLQPDYERILSLRPDLVLVIKNPIGVTQKLRSLGLHGLRVSPGVSNFLFAQTDRPASDIYDWFLDRKILLRNCTGMPSVSGEAIRFAIRTRPENERFVAAAREFFCAG